MPPLGFPHSSFSMDGSLVGCLTSLQRFARRGLHTAVVKFRMSLTSKQNSTCWGGSPWRICFRHRTDKVSCATGVCESINLHWEIQSLYYFQHLVLNYSLSGKDLLCLYGELGISIMANRQGRCMSNLSFIS